MTIDTQSKGNSNYPMKTIQKSFQHLADEILPRLLTQVCRDPNSPAFGCFDRNWWHYKIRDFPSIILQQGALALWEVSQREASPQMKTELVKLAAAGVLFWNKRAVRYGAFEEYYPWEEGYPPLAFSTLAAMKLVAAGVVTPEIVRKGAAIAAKQLLTRFESKAANQQVAGLAALAWLKKNYPDLVPDTLFDFLSVQTLSLQDHEGWFVEYDGPDIGYLSVTIDCLLDVYDATLEEKYMESAKKAAHFIHELSIFCKGNIGMHNARNTDYLVPYGLLRLIEEEPYDGKALVAFKLIFENTGKSEHFFTSVDDRYWSHYVGHSLFRAIPIFNRIKETQVTHFPDPIEKKFPSASYQLLTARNSRIMLTPRKGGLLSIWNGEKYATDFGWLVEYGEKNWVSHWWTPEWRWTLQDGRYIIKGNMLFHKETFSSPLKHVVLRMLSFALRHKIINFLKGKLIFKRSKNKILFERVVQIEGSNLVITDTLTGIPVEATVKRAPRSSKRHVASADSWHKEDACPNAGISFSENCKKENDSFFATTTYSL